ncbi:hypothetical protein LYSHEL_15070 [Lysobacter helvus]|uniref:Cellulose biosynthesis protein BcsS n=4 Tax=Lysobacteraceae TaxID=32033 RepID=A0ABN6FS47_9GAMM|nr:hypothetical protein LYSCAS_15070 [Lysobacter caseinilyticus]BCT95636.1 hypothetical protein LYSHEL_15070 [Lysobacter helvus]
MIAMQRMWTWCALACLGLAVDARAADITGSAALTSDYVWRGTTQTRGEPAVQAGVKVAGASGVYASLWGTNVDYGPAADASTEFDATVGWGTALSDDWSVDVNLLRYVYPSTRIDLDWTEANGTLMFRDRAWLSLGYSREALGGDDAGLYALVGGRLPVNDRLNLELAVGHYFLQQRDYTHAQLSAVFALAGPLSLRFTAHTTDSNAKRIFGDNAAGPRIEAALQATF